MDTLLSVGLSHQMAMLRRMDVLANNIANASTTAYKGERVTFKDHLFSMEGDAPKALRDLRFVQDFGITSSMREGPLSKTDNPLDIALDGPGFLVAEAEDGTRLYSRNGALQINANGELALVTGEPVLDVDDRPIAIGEDDVDIKIAGDGTISSRAAELAQIQIVSFERPHELERQGNSLFTTEQVEQPSPETRFVQGALEGSNVNPIEQIADMINVMRSYQSMERSLNDYGEMRDRAVAQLPRLQA